MSLIGPRPERPEIDKELVLKIPFYNLRYLYKPGLSGWAQVNYPYGASEKDAQNKLSYDLYYINNFSTLIDLLILFKTICSPYFLQINDTRKNLAERPIIEISMNRNIL